MEMRSTEIEIDLEIGAAIRNFSMQYTMRRGSTVHMGDMYIDQTNEDFVLLSMPTKHTKIPRFIVPFAYVVRQNKHTCVNMNDFNLFSSS